MKLEGLIDLLLGAGEVALAEEGDGEVVVIVGVVGIGGGGALEEWDSIVTLPAGGDSLIVDDFREGQAAGYEGEGRFCFSVFCGVEFGEAEVEISFESEAICFGDFGEGKGGLNVVSLRVLSFAEGQHGGGIAGCLLHGLLQMLDAVLRICRCDAANVVLKGTELDVGGGSEKSLLCDLELRINLAGYLPGDGVFEIE